MNVFIIAVTYMLLLGAVTTLVSQLVTIRNRTNESLETSDAMLGPEDIERHAVELAGLHISKRSSFFSENLIRRVEKNFKAITEVRDHVSGDLETAYNLPPSAEWLLDNYYIIEEQVREIIQSLPRRYYSRLPVLRNSRMRGFPRIYSVTVEMVSHSDGMVEEKSITNFIEAYQTHATLTLGELWAVPVMLRIALLGNIRAICRTMKDTTLQWRKAEEAAELLAGKLENTQEDPVKNINDFFKNRELDSPAFVERLVQRLRKHGKKTSAVIHYIDTRLIENGISLEQITGFQHQLLAAEQVTMGNLITSLKFVSTLDWAELFEALSHVEKILKKDPSGIYNNMDFESRDYYRHIVEKLARRRRVSETLVAQRAIECAEQNRSAAGIPPVNHVGYYLAGKGREALEHRLSHTSHGQKEEKFREKSSSLYTGLIITLTMIITAVFCIYTAAGGGGVGSAILVLVAVIIPASDISVTAVNFILCSTRYPSVLPKLDLKDGVPSELATMVIIPTLLTNENRVNELLDQLEVYYLANREQNLYFALAGDFKDSSSQDTAGDEGIIAAGLEGIRRLNGKYPSGDKDRFYYFYRVRSYNSTEKRWMGWERKRGAILEFNDLLRGSSDTSYKYTSSEVSKLPFIKYVITLDADTVLPMGAAKRLVGTIAHPINAAIPNRERGVVAEGYGLLQPRIGISIVSANSSLFARAFAGQGGLDPYVTAVSDVYQDLFGEGIYTGKGIYEVDIFREILKDAFPENSVLSHDLLEGIYVRTGLVTDIELVDGYPSRYASYAARLHRWVRGDWQLLPWLFDRVRDKNGNIRKNPLNFISKWKIIDNLRRSLLFPGLLLMLACGFILLPGSSLVWLLFSLLVTGFHLVVDLLNYIITGMEGRIRPVRTRTDISQIKAGFGQLFLRFAFIPAQAYMMTDAIIRTLVRLVFTRRNLLQWVTAADMEKQLKNDRTSSWRRMWLSPVTAAVLLVLAFLSKGDWYITLPVSLIWFFAPELAYRTGRKLERKIVRPGSADLKLLRRISRKTWKYFEDMVAARDNYLPPDNFQEDPPNGIAHRTSPSNIGLALASIVSARDLGYIGSADMIKRLELTLSTVDKLEKWQGHLYNWYDTTNLRVLRPAYVSTVDSGNYIGYLMAIRAALEVLDKEQLFGLRQALGLRDTIELFNEEASDMGIVIETRQLDMYLKGNSINLAEWRKNLDDIWSQITSDELRLRRVKKTVWGLALCNNLSNFRKEADCLIPFSLLPDVYAQLNIPGLEPMLGQCSVSFSLNELAITYEKLASILKGFQNQAAQDGTDITPDANEKYLELLAKTEAALEEITNLRKRTAGLLEKITVHINGVSFKPLYDPKRQLFSIGYNVDEGALSKSYYDLLASEARQASFIAVARGEVDRRHWFRLGRRMALADGRSGLVSWTGTMFEYLMPMLLMKYYENTLLDETYSFALYVQKKYGMLRGIPWGTSESAFFAFDRSLNYQYKAFGVPELGLKRGLGNEMVVAPYASIMAVTLDPAGVADNLRKLASEGMEGVYGFYEALDYTPSRMVKDRRSGIVRNYMVHHLGMSLLALNNFFNKEIMQTRFHKDPVIRCAELFLQEKIPQRNVIAQSKTDRFLPAKLKFQEEGRVIRKLGIPDTETPKMHVLSNGSYSVLLTDGGSGQSRRGRTAVTRWKEDTRDSSGFFIFVQNINSNEAWSATYDPFGNRPEYYAAVFAPDRAEFSRKDGSIETRTQVVVSTEDNVEIRRLILTNRSQHNRTLEITSYLEVVLADSDADLAHPAFSKLFVTTGFVPELDCLLASRRPRSKEQKQAWAMHMMTVDGETIGDVQYETDRMKFIGRNNSLSRPHAMEADQPLSNSMGPVLDPIFSLRRRIRLQPGQTVKLAYILGTAESREGVMELAEKYRDRKNHERAFELARTRSLVESRYLDLKAAEVEIFLEMLPSIMLPCSIRRRWLKDTTAVTGGQPGLWPFGISGDLPIVVVILSDKDEMDILHLFLKGSEFFRLKGINFDLVIIVDDDAGYMQPLLDMVREAVSTGFSRDANPKSGGVFILDQSQLSDKESLLLMTAARLWVKVSAAPVSDQISPILQKVEFQPFEPAKDIEARQGAQKTSCQCFDTGKLLFFNGTGGFEPDGSEYVIYLKQGLSTPAPWSNIITNGAFGSVTTESGPGYTWSENSRENKLTPWSNDPVTDQPGEAIYVRDEADGEYWSLTPAPKRGNADYIVRHGFGYTQYTNESYGLAQSLTLFIPEDCNIKLYLVSVTNNSETERRISATFYSRPVLGVNEKITAQYLVSGEHKETGIITVQNVFSSNFPGRVFFADVSETERFITGSRDEFYGVSGSLEEPQAMRTARLSGKVGAGLDPCAAVQTFINIKSGETHELVFMLGEGRNMEEALSVSNRFRSVDTVKQELIKIKNVWRHRLGAIKTATPDKSIDTMLNGWLLYQVIACRLQARSAFYQSGGALGFRDQLQDVMALVLSGPELTRSQILLHASRQFAEGDVQHWWHPEEGKGIRTRYSDDLLWLPYVTADYVKCTGDSSILSETVHYIEGDLLGEDEAERYDTPRSSNASDTLYNHCIKAIDRSLKFGGHGIPLMGSGDWNDGMNTVGIEGKGESVWLGWFLVAILENFQPLCIAMGESDRAEHYCSIRNEIIQALENTAWDGSWYRRAYFDDGTPLGSVQNMECKIDSVVQSWAVISGAAKESRANEAMTAVDNYLVDREENIIKLLTPPFHDGDLSPGYIKSYVPGVRENGGQYTHAAVWVVLAYAKLGLGNKAFELYHLLNPVNHGRTPLEVSRYKVEPYVMAADVYAVQPNVGRGGWTWYTGAAGWMYRVGIEHILGIKKQGELLLIDPCIPSGWDKYSVDYRFGGAMYHINVSNPEGVEKGVKSVSIDGAVSEKNEINLINDGGEHTVTVTMGH